MLFRSRRERGRKGGQELGQSHGWTFVACASAASSAAPRVASVTAFTATVVGNRSRAVVAVADGPAAGSATGAGATAGGIAGMISLGILSPMRIGWEGIRQMAIEDLGMMILAGLCNFAAFYSLTKALQLTSLLYVNALGASQAMLAAIAGVALFHEAASRSLEIGIALSVVGILMMSRTRRKPGG